MFCQFLLFLWIYVKVKVILLFNFFKEILCPQKLFYIKNIEYYSDSFLVTVIYQGNQYRIGVFDDEYRYIHDELFIDAINKHIECSTVLIGVPNSKLFDEMIYYHIKEKNIIEPGFSTEWIPDIKSIWNLDTGTQTLINKNEIILFNIKS